VSQDTQEMYYSSKRQQFLIDQGYAFKVITGLPPADATDLVYASKQAQLKLLQSVLVAVETGTVDEDESDPEDDVGKMAVKRVQGKFKSLSGGDDMAYMERKSAPKERHTLFKKYFGK
jgi:DNA excision repair protein ERCC-3